MPSTSLLLACLILPQEALPLPLPTATLPTPTVRVGAALDGRHILIDEPGLVPLPQAAPAALTEGLVAQLLGEEARRLGLEARVQAIAGRLYVQGTPEAARALEPALRRLADLEAELSIDLEARWNPGTSDRASTARVRSGGIVELGVRQRRPFLASYQVDVTSDSGVADPLLGEVWTGRSLIVRATRVEGGVQLVALLDVAELEALTIFDPDTPDLGQFEQPTVSAVQVAFGGLVVGDEPLIVTLAGLPPGLEPLTLELRARCQPAPSEPEAGWAVFDVAALAGPALALEPARPGHGLDFEVVGLFGTAPKVPASTLANLLDGQRAFRRAPLWTEDLLFVPAEETGPARTRDLVRALTGPGGTPAGTRRLELVRGELRITAPILDGAPVRVLVGSEWVQLVDYDTELAPQTWMGEPRVEWVFDGIAFEGTPRLGMFTGRAFASASETLAPLEQEDVGLGRLQRAKRSGEVHSVRLSLPAEASMVVGETEPSLRVSLRDR